jgi:hypothetical protein
MVTNQADEKEAIDVEVCRLSERMRRMTPM